MYDDADSGDDSLDTQDFGYGDDPDAAGDGSDTADAGSDYADYGDEENGEGDDSGASWLMGDDVGYGDQGSAADYSGDSFGTGDEMDGLNAQDYGSDDGQEMGKPADPCKGYRAICQKHPAWAGECRDTVDKAQADADAHNKTYHGGTPWAGVLD